MTLSLLQETKENRSKKYDIKQLVGQTLKGITSGVTGTVVSTRYSTTTTADTLYVN